MLRNAATVSRNAGRRTSKEGRLTGTLVARGALSTITATRPGNFSLIRLLSSLRDSKEWLSLNETAALILRRSVRSEAVTQLGMLKDQDGLLVNEV
jgi:hypothetical protein